MEDGGRNHLDIGGIGAVIRRAPEACFDRLGLRTTGPLADGLS
ncbi:MAG: hypothetical protein OJF60_000426 [Burkholderiaceae bacterium]|jgi:hypothetical protein|nr:MAG: hypothetical protein OJF60_000426 [Burkholderiaceae bacterium]